MAELDDEDEGGRGAADANDDEGRETADVEDEVLNVLAGRVGELRLEEGVPVRILVGVGGVEVGVVFNVLSAARCGRGLIGRAPLSADEATEDVPDFRFSSFSSSSELLKRRRVPARTATGDGGFSCSEAADFGRYLGNEEATRLVFFARRVPARVRMPDLGVLLAESTDFGGCSSEVVLAAVPDTRLRVETFESGVAVLVVAWDGDLVSPIDARGGDGLAWVLSRRESFAFLDVLLASLLSLSLSLFMTSEKALLTEARLRDCLMDVLLVTGLVFGLGTAGSLGMDMGVTRPDDKLDSRARSSRVVILALIQREGQQQRRGRLAKTAAQCSNWHQFSSHFHVAFVYVC